MIVYGTRRSVIDIDILFVKKITFIHVYQTLLKAQHQNLFDCIHLFDNLKEIFKIVIANPSENLETYLSIISEPLDIPIDFRE